MPRLLSFALALPLLAACNTGAPKEAPKPEPAKSAAAAQGEPKPGEGVLRLGEPIEKASAAQKVSLGDVAKDPNAFVGKSITTTGTVTAVCQHMGCWMEIKDDASQAHIKMAGHSFFVPKTASGRKARVLATVQKVEGDGACAEEAEGKVSASAAGEKKENGKSGCRAEAEKALGRPLAKLELVAQGVELL
jgi:hypothetical protein